MKKNKSLILIFVILVFCFTACGIKEEKDDVLNIEENEINEEDDIDEENNDIAYTIVSLGTKLSIPKGYEVWIDDTTGDIYISDQNLNWELVMIVREGVYEDSMVNPEDLMSNIDPDEASIIDTIKEIDVEGKKYAYFTFAYNDSEEHNTVIYTGATDKTRIAMNMRIIGDISDEEAIEDVNKILSRIETTDEADTLQADLDKADREPIGVAKDSSVLKCNSYEVKFQVPQGFYSVNNYEDETMSTESFLSEDEAVEVNVNLDISGIWENENEYLDNELKSFDRDDDYYKTLDLSDIKTMECNGFKVYYILEKYTIESEGVEEVHQKIYAIISVEGGNYLTVSASTLSDIDLTIDVIKDFFFLGDNDVQ